MIATNKVCKLAVLQKFCDVGQCNGHAVKSLAVCKERCAAIATCTYLAWWDGDPAHQKECRLFSGVTCTTRGLWDHGHNQVFKKSGSIQGVRPCILLRCNRNSRIQSPSSGGCSCRGKPHKPVCAGTIHPDTSISHAKTFANSCEARCQGFSSWRDGKCPSGHIGNTHSVSNGNPHSSPGDRVLNFALILYNFTDSQWVH